MQHTSRRRESNEASSQPTEPRYPTKQALAMSAIFVSFTCVRAIHPTIITASKTRLPDGTLGFAYQSASTIIFPPLLICLGSQLFILATEGYRSWRSIWRPRPMIVFGINGLIFAFGDWLEMESLSQMHGAAYQILNQSKILITALLMVPLKGVYQTRFQWVLLTALMIVMSEYMVIQSASRNSSNGIPVSAYMFTLLKITISCFGAVYTDKYAKEYSRALSLPAQMVHTYLGAFVFITAFASCSTNIWSIGFFRGWDFLTLGVAISFCVKASVSFTVVAVLDAILKNIGECVSVLLIFFYDVLAPWVDFDFEVPTFLAVMVTILVMGAYVDSKQTCEKALKYDACTADLRENKSFVASALQLLEDRVWGA